MNYLSQLSRFLQDIFQFVEYVFKNTSRRIRWAGHVARMGERRGLYRDLVGKPEGKRPFGRSRLRWEDSTKKYFEKNQMGGACSAYGGEEAYTVFWWGSLRERDHLGDQDVDGRIILRWIFRKLEGVVGTGWSCLRIGTDGGHLWVR